MAPQQVPVTLEFTHPDTQPPIYLAGSFSDPEWQPQEMEHTSVGENQFRFYKEVLVEQGGQFQYKFRIGQGDWWALNEDAPTITDEVGNRNNLLTVPILEHDAEKKVKKHEAPADKTEAEIVPIPEVIVEKVDDKPSHGDDFGEDATAAQKEAREKRAQDAEPDLVIVNGDVAGKSVTDVEHNAENLTNSVAESHEDSLDADTAAEVAESAAIIDREASPIPVSDEEAGRTGERRLSMTPIPEVANTAAEVADSAALLDVEEFKKSLSPHFAHLSVNHSGSGDSTPYSERAPLFAHERLVPYEGEGVAPVQEYTDSRRPSVYENEESIDTDDPFLEEFPDDRESILEHVMSTESRLNADETHFDEEPISPVVSHGDETNHLDPSPITLPKTPSLASITEETHDLDGPAPISGPSKTLEEGLDGDVLAVSGDAEGSLVVVELPPGTTVSVDEVESTEDTVSGSGPEHSFDAVVPSAVTLEPIYQPTEHMPAIIEEGGNGEESNSRSINVENTPEIIISTAPESSLTLPHEELSKGEADSEDLAANIEQDTPMTSEFTETNEPVSDHSEARDMAIEARDEVIAEREGVSPKTVDGPKSILETIATTTIPDIVEAAKSIPEASISAVKPIPEAVRSIPGQFEAAVSTSVDSDSGKGDLKLRNTTPPERSGTPPSVHPKDNTGFYSFLHNIWRTVFVGWIGGLISRLFGDKRRP